MASGIAPSKGMARRLVEQGAVSLGGVKIQDISLRPNLDRDEILKAGRKMKRYRPGV